MNSKSVHNATKLYAIFNSKSKSVYEKVRDLLQNDTIICEEHYLPFIWNRGVAVQNSTSDSVCFCPPSFYGSQYQFYSDRMTVTTYLDLANYMSPFHQIAIIKVLTTFLFENRIIDHYEFYVNQSCQQATFFRSGLLAGPV